MQRFTWSGNRERRNTMRRKVRREREIYTGLANYGSAVFLFVCKRLSEQERDGERPGWKVLSCSVFFPFVFILSIELSVHFAHPTRLPEMVKLRIAGLDSNCNNRHFGREQGVLGRVVMNSHPSKAARRKKKGKTERKKDADAPKSAWCCPSCRAATPPSTSMIY